MTRLRIFQILPIVGVLLFGVLALTPVFPGIPMVLPEAGVCFIVPNPLLNLVVALIGLALPLYGRILSVRITAPSEAISRRIYPLVLLPVSFAGFWVPGIVPLEWAANFLFFFPIAIVSVCLFRWWNVPHLSLEKYTSSRLAWGLLSGLTILYTVCGTYVSYRIGEHAVDEGHYLIQATSLYEDRDLDIKNNFGFDVEAAIDRAVARQDVPPGQEAHIRAVETGKLRAYLHVSGKSQGDRWYSWHPYGISLLIAPTMGIGLPARQFVLGFIAALGSTIVFLLCLELGRTRTWSFLLSIMFALAIFWFVFAIRALPEALGATLFSGAVYASFIARRRPALAIGLLVFCCGFMPIVHPRFLPCVGLAGLYFVIRAFFIDPLPRNARILFAVMLGVGGAGAIAFMFLHRAAYASLTAYPLTNLFWAYPEGAWLLLFSERGMIFSMPGAVVLLIGTVYALFKDRNHRLFYGLVAVAFLSLLLSLGTTDCWDGGPTMNGRYLVVGSLLLIPGWVYLFEKSHGPGRLWMLFLAVYSAAYTVVCLFTLSDVGATMLRIPLQGIREYVAILRGLFIPYVISNIHVGHPYHGLEAFIVNPFPVILLLVTAIIVWPARNMAMVRIRTAMALAVLFVSSVVLHIRHGDTSSRWRPERVEKALSSVSFERALLRWEQPGQAGLLKRSNRFENFSPRSLTTRDLGRVEVEGMYSQPRLDINDWGDRGYRWFTLVQPFKSGKAGPRMLRIEGRTEGSPQLIVCIREGRHLVLEQTVPVEPDSPIDVSIDFRTEGKRGDTYLLFRIDGEDGTVYFDRIQWTPVPRE
ncbi:MAG TPA: hypothetical protein PJ991_09865 [Kiritimatiellia bacterium]|nr:hypothetical protein [Kiritimatiellia bacterium]